MRWVGNIRWMIITGWKPILYAILLFLVGCATSPLINTSGIPTPTALTESSLNDLSVLTWIGGICILFGTLSMVVPFLSTFNGATSIVIGVLLILLNIALKEYLHWIYVPILIGAAAVTVAVSYKSVRFILRRKQKCPHSSEHSGLLSWLPWRESPQALGSDHGSQSSSNPNLIPEEENDATEDRGSTAP